LGNVDRCGDLSKYDPMSCLCTYVKNFQVPKKAGILPDKHLSFSCKTHQHKINIGYAGKASNNSSD
jgi:hypothetical protein